MDNDTQRNTNSGLGLIALITAGVALAIGVAAYNKTGEHLGNVVADKTNEAVDTAKVTTNQAKEDVTAAKDNAAQTVTAAKSSAQFETRLAAVRASVAANQVTDETVSNIESIRTDLKDAYANASGDVKANADKMDADLQRLEGEAKQDTVKATATLDDLIARIKNGDLDDNK